MKKTLILFDLDHTLIPIDSDQIWGQFLCNINAVNKEEYQQKNQHYYEQYTKGSLNINEFLNFCLQPLHKNSRQQLHKWQQLYLNTIIIPHIHKHVLELVKNAQQKAVCLLVTATNSFVSLPIAQILGFSSEHLIATEPNTENNLPWYHENNDSSFNGKVLGLPNFQHNKITRIEQWLNNNNIHKDYFNYIVAYSDSHNDIPMLEWADMAIATNPDPTLLIHAEKNNWPVLQMFNKH